MSLGEQVILRIVLVLFIAFVVFAFRMIVALIKGGWNALMNPGGRKPQPKPPVTPVQPPKPPVTPVQPPKPSVPPQYQSFQRSLSQIPEGYSGTIPLDPDSAFPFYTSQNADTGYCLNCVRGPLQGRRFPIRAGGISIGRDQSSCDICLPGNTPGISRLHCRLTVENGQILLTDNNSTYGTYSGFGQRLTPGTPHCLQLGEAFFLGSGSGPVFVLEKT